MKKLSDKARELAVKLHGDQKYGSRPYIYHLDMVAGFVGKYGDDAVTVAYLHDVLEDTAMDARTLLPFIGIWLLEQVMVCSTRADMEKESRAKKMEWMYRVWKECTDEHSIALIVKTADRLSNLICSIDSRDQKRIQMYLAERVAFREAVYRPGICDDLWDRMDQEWGRVLSAV